MGPASDHKYGKPEISCRVINTILKYAQQQNKDTRRLIEGLFYDEKYLTDTNNWISREMSTEICQRLKLMFDDDEIMYKVAFASEKLHAMGFLDNIGRLMGKPEIIIKNAPKLNKYFAKVDEIEVLRCGPSSAVVKYYAKPGYKLTADDCYYAKGILSVLPTILSSKPAQIWEEKCSVPIEEKGRIDGKFYTVDEKGYVTEHDGKYSKPSKATSSIIGKLNDDGTFKLADTVYGAKYCLFHVWWSPKNVFLKNIFYERFIKPKVLEATVGEMEKENDIIEQKYEELYQNSLQLQQHYVDTISALIRALDAKDHYTKYHSMNVSYIAEIVAKELMLPAHKIETIRLACKLHDLGKIGIKDSILLKPGRLTPEEWTEIKKHPAIGAEIIKPLAFLSEVAMLVRQDHERFDGMGYPDGLKSEQIDIGARVISVADAYDAMVSGRLYQKPLSKQDAIEEIKGNSGRIFDPDVAEAFLRALPKIEQVHQVWSELEKV